MTSVLSCHCSQRLVSVSQNCRFSGVGFGIFLSAGFFELYCCDDTRLQANVNSVTVEPVPRQNEASFVVHSRPPKSPRPPPAVRYQPAVFRRSVLSPDENLEIASYLQRQPSTPPPIRARRAVSVPPPSAPVSRPSVPRWFPSSGAYYGRRGGRYSVAAAVPVALPPATVTTHLPSDAVVGVAHTSLYGDIVIGIPYKKRFMFNAQVRGHRGLDSHSNVPKVRSLTLNPNPTKPY